MSDSLRIHHSRGEIKQLEISWSVEEVRLGNAESFVQSPAIVMVKYLK